MKVVSSAHSIFSVLVVDDEARALTSCRRILNSVGIENVICCQDSRNVMNILTEEKVGVVLLDLSMPHITGQELLGRITEEHPDVSVIVVTGFNEVDTAVECIKAGASDYMVKPVEKSRMESGVKRALELCELQNECGELKARLVSQTLEHPEAFKDILTNNATMKSVFQYLEAVARTSKPVLITGETGVGKELVVQALHKISGVEGPLVGVNVAGVDDNVFADTLFGHARGAYTGAESGRAGLLEQASGGTLLLDEIGDLSPASQIKLIRLIQERKYFPLGSDVAKPVQAQFVFTTNRDLDSLVEQGSFRRDLLYRLRTHHVHLPPLRERIDDVPLLVEHFVATAAKALGKAPPTYPPELVTLLRNYHYPGNVRELEALVFDAVSRHKSRILSMEVFRNYLSEKSSSPVKVSDSSRTQHEKQPPIALGPEFPTLNDTTQYLISEALSRAEGNLSIAAHLLGISRQALSKRIRRAKD